MPSETSALPTTAVIIQLRVIRLQRAKRRHSNITRLRLGYFSAVMLC